MNTSTRIALGSLALTISLLAGNASAQQTCRPAPEQCAPRLRHIGLQIIGPAWNAPTTICSASLPTTDEACRTNYDVRALPQQVEVVNGRCTGVGHWACRPTTPPPPPSPSACCRDRPSSSSDGYTSRQRFEWVKQQLMLHWARIILESRRNDAQDRRLNTVEDVQREHGQYLDMLADSIVTGFGIDNEALVRASTEQPGDGPSSRMERVVTVFNNGSQAFRDSIVRLGDRTTVLERRADYGGTRFEPGASAQIMSVGPAVATTVGVTLQVEHRTGTGDGAYVGGRWSGGAGHQTGIPAAVFSSVTEAYAGYRVAPFLGLQAGVFHAVTGRMDECNPATEPCGIMMHAGGGEFGAVFGGEGMGPVNVDLNLMLGYGTGRSGDGTIYSGSEGLFVGGNLRLTIRPR